MYVKLPIVLLALIEGSLLVFATYLAAPVPSMARGGWRPTASGDLLPAALVYASFGVVSLFAVGLYSTRQRSTTAGVMVRILAADLNAVGLSALVYYFLPAIAVGRGVLGLMAILGALTLAWLRLLFERVVDENLFKRRVLVYGAGKRAASLLELRRRSDMRGFQIVAFVAAEGDNVTADADRLTRRPDDLFRWSINNQVDEVVVAMDDRRRNFPMHEFLECRLAGIDVLELPTFLERETGKVRLDVLSPSWLIFGSGFSASPLQRAMERGFDILASFALLVVSLRSWCLRSSPFALKTAGEHRYSTGSGGSVVTAGPSTCSSSAAWRSTRSRARQSGRSRTTRASPGWAASCARRASMNFRSC